jgi:hypothetical protein
MLPITKDSEVLRTKWKTNILPTLSFATSDKDKVFKSETKAWWPNTGKLK